MHAKSYDKVKDGVGFMVISQDKMQAGGVGTTTVHHNGPLGMMSHIHYEMDGVGVSSYTSGREHSIVTVLLQLRSSTL